MGYFKLKKVQDLVWEIEGSTNSEKQTPKYLLNSQIDKEKELDMVLGRIDFSHHKNFIVFGMKNIKLLSEIYKRKTIVSTMVIIEICKETEENLFVECDEKDLAFLFDRKRVNLTIGSQDELVAQLSIVLGDMLKLYNLRNTEIISMPYMKSMYPNEMQGLTKIIFERLHTFVSSYGNSVEDILLGMDNYLDNWRHIFRSIDYIHFKDMYKDKPAIIVGAGPSLDKNIQQLKRAKGKALILCVDAALNSLLNVGIVPDLVASIERLELTSKFYNREDIPDEIVFVGPNVVKDFTLNKFERIIFTGRAGDALIRDFGSYIGFNNLDIGGNVSNVLIAFTEHLGCNPITFIGLDLAYTGGRTHTAGVSEALGKENMIGYKDKENIVYVKGQNGEMLETLEFFMYAKNWIEMNMVRNSQNLFINATEGGAMIEGALNQKLAEVIEKYCLEDLTPFSDLYDKIKEDIAIDKLGTTQKALDYIKEVDKYLRRISKKAFQYLNKIRTHKGVGLVNLMEKQRGEMQAALDKNSAGRFILQSIIISYNRDIHSFPMYLSKEDEKKMLGKSIDFYDTIKKVCDRVSEDFKAYKLILDRYLEICQKEEETI
ncbi:hypothetical protein LY28_00941 [Ruminiclostridium sufflavum DSM 19573]|uniref:6-hydroxymethylpterin diphosphokinase MptE-like domain-containing protein n=1 Tax=Ruminiclostridium sufflavum DSM 19573 TaxID=1121337 RepID=A0A318XPN1_9FIRM|nr:6-hydroxymethylpterin diphosphokinase MptE-like protein [Ruminiclostridium sufflavum]PYG89118.1 hypothetical protein LY28_00941 [Ruminiclostridium sufflavum DSM 19573]